MRWPTATWRCGLADDARAARVTVRVRYFAALREALGAEEHIEVAVGSTVGELQARLRGRSERHAEMLAPGRPMRVALDHNLLDAPETVCISSAAEIAFFPPVTGG